MSEKKYTIGEVSKITGISKDTLRFYDKIDLLKPKFVDSDNHYRYYTYDQFWSIDIISCCRSLNIPIEKIRNILSSNDNEKVLELFLEQKEEALRLSHYYQKVVEDIDWYSKKHEQIQNAYSKTSIEVKYFPERLVLYGKNSAETHAYHLKLQELCREAVNHKNTIRRNYGFVLDETLVSFNQFVKLGEYVLFDDDILDQVNPKYLTLLPAGEYACCILKVKDGQADFSPLLNWIIGNDRKFSLVLADEIGIQLFEYQKKEYLCSVKILLE